MMKSLKLTSLLLLFIANAVLWALIHLGLSKAMTGIDTKRFTRFNFLFRNYPVEKDGELWNRLFRIKKWKAKLPESTLVLPGSFDQSNMKSMDAETIGKHIEETKRAELTHWLSILPVPLFFPWNPPYARRIHLFYALASNIPFIIAQRYNRPRLQRLYNMKSQRFERIE